MNIYVGNLSYNTTEDDLREAFGVYGSVSTCNLIVDKMTGRSKGFGFVEMPDNSEADAAIKGLNGKALDSRSITVNQARPRESRPTGGRGGRRF